MQELLGRTARDFFAREFPLDRIREGHRSEAGYGEALRPAIRELGWTRAPFPEEMGGGGGGLLGAALVIEEIVASAFLLFFAMFCLWQVRSVRHKEDG